ncbi:MAG: transketolase [Candidatus Aminicenantes bacterium]|nr:transketolase [Candidatus Aminicenantes bacterium]
MSEINARKVRQAADYVRYLSLIAIEKAQSGHPGLPLGCADLGVVLYRYFLKHDPTQPQWSNRDRFVLSAGHGSMLLYSLLFMSGFSVTLDDLNRFRQWQSRTPGHPEFHAALGVETTTGPLGQGFANAVGMAIAAKWRAQRYNRPGYQLFNNRVFCLVGDGCLMEGISYEAASLAGHLGLDNLVTIYDANRVSIDGHTDITFTEDVAARFRAQGWLVAQTDGNEPRSFATALESLLQTPGKPLLLIANTVIGSGLDRKQDSSKIHGAPAGLEEIAHFVRHSTMKPVVAAAAGIDPENDTDGLMAWLKRQAESETPLLTHAEALEFMREKLPQQRKMAAERDDLWHRYQREFPQSAAEILQSGENGIPVDLDSALAAYREDTPDATRNISGRVLNLCAGHIPFLVGGSADLAGSTKATIFDSAYLGAGDFSGRNIAYGVREHAMAAIGNGLALDGTIIPFSGTFFSFFDYLKPALRLAALMRLRHLFIFSHDSIYLGEDGPTHQPVEHLNSLRLIPGLISFRPADDRETAWAFRYFFKQADGPVAIVTTRQKVSPQGRPDPDWSDFLFGAYEYKAPQTNKAPDLVIMASGSELSAATAAAGELEETERVCVRVVSVPCLELFSAAPYDYRKALLQDFQVPVFLVEAASYRGVDAWFHPGIHLIDIQRFGQSAPGKVLGDQFGVSAHAVAATIRACLKG